VDSHPLAARGVAVDEPVLDGVVEDGVGATYWSTTSAAQSNALTTVRRRGWPPRIVLPNRTRSWPHRAKLRQLGVQTKVTHVKSRGLRPPQTPPEHRVGSSSSLGSRLSHHASYCKARCTGSPSCRRGPAINVLALVGTRKGLFLLRCDNDRRRWHVDGPLLDGWAVFHATVDPRDGTVYAAANHVVYGPTVQRSTDTGETWKRSRQIGLPAESGLTLEATWHIEPGLPEEPETLYLGGAPGVLFRSDDRGETWEVNRGILEHATRERWFPGAGGMSCHSIQLDPRDPQRLYVAITAAGVFRSDDGGETWTPLNHNVRADFLADPFSEVGQCPHKLLLHPARPDRLWQQNHFGVYRSDDQGDSWLRLDENGLPSGFGFPLMLDPQDPDAAFVIPEKGPEYHYSPGGRLAVYRTRDSGATWELMDDGLPEQAWAAVLREASASDAESLYFGTQSGSFFALADEDRWVEAVRHLPPILSVEVTEWSR
jgi:photosystem II stability/assembly factor-like uncharacterized protein